jgi:hypothetical protein
MFCVKLFRSVVSYMGAMKINSFSVKIRMTLKNGTFACNVFNIQRNMKVHAC